MAEDVFVASSSLSRIDELETESGRNHVPNEVGEPKVVGVS